MTLARIYVALFVVAILVANVHGAYAGVVQTMP
jgi:hypothetical protein